MQRALCIAGLAVCVTALAAAAPRAAAAQDHPNITPGKWELTIKQEFEMPGFKGAPPMTTTTCIKPDQVKSNQSFAERMTQHHGDKGGDSKCVYSGFTATASQVSFSFSCENGPTGQSEIKFAGDSYEITTHATAPSRGGSGQGEMHFTQHISGKRIGDC